MPSDGRGPGVGGGGLRIGREEAAPTARLPSSRPPLSGQSTTY